MGTKQLTVAIEGTAALGPFWQPILSDYLEKIIRCFCSAEPAGQKPSNVELSLVVFNSHGSYSACLVQRSGWTRDMDIFFQWLSAIPFAGGGFNDAAIAEGLAEVLMMFSSPTGSQNQNAGMQRHCILIAASNPYPLPTPVYQLLPQKPEKSENIESQPDNRLSDAETLAKSFGQCGISLSVLCPKQLPKLRGIYNAACNLRAADPPVDNVKNPHFLVLISENFIEARSSLSRSGTTSLPLNQNTLKTDVTAIPPISGPPPASVPSANGSVLGRQPISVGSIPPAATVKVEPTTVTSLAGGPTFPHIPSVARAASQAVPSLQTSSPMSTSQEMIPSNENVPDMKPLVNNITPQVRPIGCAAANVRILNDVAQARQALAGGTSIGLSSIGGTPMLSNMISSGITSSIPPSQTVISSAPLGVASISGPLPLPGAGPVPNSAPAQYISATSNPPVNSSLGMTQPLGNIQGSVSLGQAITSMSQGNLPATQMVQTGMNMNQNMMTGSGTSGISSDNGTMMPTPGMSQQGQPGLQPIGVNNSNSMTNLPLNQQTSNAMPSTKSKYMKVWEGNLSGQRQGQPVFITRLEGYRNSSASETLAANWPPTMQIVRLISQDHMNNRQYVGKADFLVFRAMNQHGFLGQLQEKKLCAVIQLPSQTLLLSVTDIAHRLIGMLFPGDMVVFKPQNQQQQQPLQQMQQQNMQQQQQPHQQMQQQQQPLQQMQQQQPLQQMQQLQQQQSLQQMQQQQQLPQMQHQQPLSHMQQQQQQPLMQIQQQQPQMQLQQQQQIPQMQQQQQIQQMQQQQQIQQMQQQQQIPQMQQQQQQITQMQQQQQIPQMQQPQQMVGTGMNQSYIQGGGRSQLLSQGQVSSQGPPSISGGSGFMS